MILKLDIFQNLIFWMHFVYNLLVTKVPQLQYLRNIIFHLLQPLNPLTFALKITDNLNHNLRSFLIQFLLHFLIILPQSIFTPPKLTLQHLLFEHELMKSIMIFQNAFFDIYQILSQPTFWQLFSFEISLAQSMTSMLSSIAFTFSQIIPQSEQIEILQSKH